MQRVMRKWGIAIISIFLCVLGIIGNLIVDPNWPFVLGIITGMVLIVLLNVIYVVYIQKN
ncbi:MAG TPA: hypothetical protein VK037_00410 [Pseudogracilibacillus sp.]|nr:hypothetical protein [Pseudogracilibacillus sp.]